MRDAELSVTDKSHNLAKGNVTKLYSLQVVRLI